MNKLNEYIDLQYVIINSLRKRINIFNNNILNVYDFVRRRVLLHSKLVYAIH